MKMNIYSILRNYFLHSIAVPVVSRLKLHQHVSTESLIGTAWGVPMVALRSHLILMRPWLTWLAAIFWWINWPQEGAVPPPRLPYDPAPALWDPRHLPLTTVTLGSLIPLQWKLQRGQCAIQTRLKYKGLGREFISCPFRRLGKHGHALLGCFSWPRSAAVCTTVFVQ